MKKWKDAGSIIIVAATSLKPFSSVTVFGGLNKDYNELSKEKPDFQILALKKSSESPLLAGRYVFPGGTANLADSSDEWIQLFKKFGYSVDFLRKLLNNNNTKLAIFEDHNDNVLPRCISLRITAIREAFEESGVLLCKRKAHELRETVHKPVKAEHLTIEDHDTWRKKVLQNPHEFLNLCIHHDCYPDITSLYLWSNWLSPSNLPVRFDSIFFTVFLENITYAYQDNYEIESLKWVTAPELLFEFYAGKSLLHFPQFYELSRLARFISFYSLAEFAFKLNGMENEVWMPVWVYAKDGAINLLPGDDLYPKHADYFTPYFIADDTRTVESFKTHTMHRMVVDDKTPHLIKFIIENLNNSSFKHVLPWCPTNPEDLKGHL